MSFRSASLPDKVIFCGLLIPAISISSSLSYSAKIAIISASDTETAAIRPAPCVNACAALRAQISCAACLRSNTPAAQAAATSPTL